MVKFLFVDKAKGKVKDEKTRIFLGILGLICLVAITNLMMQTYLCNCDFKKRVNKRGIEYGWDKRRDYHLRYQDLLLPGEVKRGLSLPDKGK